MGREVNGRFSSFRTKFVRFVKKLAFWSVIALLIYGAFQFGISSSETTYARETIEVDNLGKKVEQIKNEALDALMHCESAGYSEEDGIVIFDSNSKASYGQYQWQKASVQHYYKTLYNQEITPKQAVLIALETEKARKLAYDVIFTTEKGWSNWYNCANKTKLQETLALISKLEK